MQSIGEKCRAAHEYSFEGDLVLSGQKGTAPGRVLSEARVKLASAPGGKFYLRIEGAGKDAYVLVSNGQKSWAWVPKLKQYTEEETAVSEGEGDDEEGPSDTERDLAETFVRLVVPVLAKIDKNAQAADFHGEVGLKFENRKVSWPLLRVLSKPESDKTQTFTQLAVDPESLAVGRIVYSTALHDTAEKNVVQMAIDFSKFQIGPVDPATFEFAPPKGAKLVETIPIPGQTGSALLNQPAPDFELKTLEGEKVRLADLRGHPVLLSFWASWCGPCRRELPGLEKIYEEYKDRGLVILGINDEGKGPARKYSEKEGLGFQTLDDSSSKAHRLYKVHAIPTVFVIDKNGKIAVFMKGSREPEKIKSALASVGF